MKNELNIFLAPEEMNKVTWTQIITDKNQCEKINRLKKIDAEEIVDLLDYQEKKKEVIALQNSIIKYNKEKIKPLKDYVNQIRLKAIIPYEKESIELARNVKKNLELKLADKAEELGIIVELPEPNTIHVRLSKAKNILQEQIEWLEETKGNHTPEEWKELLSGVLGLLG